MNVKSCSLVFFLKILCLVPVFSYGYSQAQSSPTQGAPSMVQEGFEEQSALEFVRELGDKAIVTLTQKNLSDHERRSRFTVLFNEYFAGPDIGKFVLGRYWRRAVPAQKSTYLNLFVKSVAATYAVRFSEYKPDDSFEVLKAIPQPDHSLKVKSVLNRPQGGPISFVWVLYKIGNTFKIYDVIIEGVSMSISQRSEYSSLIQRNGGSIQAFLETLKQSSHS